MLRPERCSQETPAQSPDSALVPPQGMQTTVSLSSFADTEIFVRLEKLTECCPQACRPQASWNQNIDGADSHLPHL